MRIILSLILTITICTLRAQAPFKQSYDVFGDNFTKGFHTNTLDGGMILLSRSANISGGQYFTIFKTDITGNLQWSQRYIQPGNCNLSNIVQLPDSSYFFCFVELNYPEKYYITHLDKYGTLLYCKSITPPSNFIVAFDPFCILKPDGNVYIISDLHNQTTNMYGWHVFEVDMNGNIVFSNCYNGGSLKCLLRGGTRCTNGDLLLTGYQRDSTAMHFGPAITRIDSDGVMLWSKMYIDTTQDITGISIFEMTNGHIVVSGSHTTPGNEIVRLETDANGTLIRAREYGNATSGLSPYTSAQAENKTTLIFGTADSGSFCMKLDSLGFVLHAEKFHWIVPNRINMYGSSQYSFSGVDTQSNHAVIFTSDSTLTSCFGLPMQIDTGTSDFRVTNISYTYPVPLYDTLFALQDTGTPGTNTKVCGPIGISELDSNSDLLVYPNPAYDIVHVEYSERICRYELFDSRGRLIISQATSEYNPEINVGQLNPGLYLLRIQTETAGEQHRIIVE